MSQSIVPLGEGDILGPSRFSKRDYVKVKAYYSPHLTGTIINKRDIMRGTKKERNDFLGLTLQKYSSNEDDEIDT